MTNLTLSSTQLQVILESFTQQPNGFNQLLEITLNTLLKAERRDFLDTSTQSNKANGFRPIQGLGFGQAISILIPRDRLGLFKPYIVDIMREQSDQLQELCFELYCKGLTTRDIEDIIGGIYGQQMGRSQISRISQTFYDEMRAYRNRQLEPYYPIVMMDATFIKTKRVDHVSCEAYYIVLGVKPDTTREIIGVYNFPTESASNWDEVLADLKHRGLEQMGLMVMDGLKGADDKVFQHFNTTIQKCVLHLKRNALKRVKKTHRDEMTKDLSDVWNMYDMHDTMDQARQRLHHFVDKWAKHYDYFNQWRNWDQMHCYFTYTRYSFAIRRMIYTTNWIERFNKKIKRATKIRNSFPNPESVLMLISKVSLDTNEGSYKYPIPALKAEALFNN